jgi:hypothetical protein
MIVNKLLPFQELNVGNKLVKGFVRVVSASSSFLRLILSLRPSASRLAAVILACICSPLISAAISTGKEVPGMGGLVIEEVGGIEM